LTALAALFVLKEMSDLNSVRDEGSVKAAMVRWHRGGATGWRRMATVAAGLLALALGYHVMFGQNGLTAYEQKRQETRALQQQLQSLQHENELLKGHVERLQTDPDAIEHQAREELHYTRPGEVIYALPDVPAEAQKSSDGR
jgi:cell division protein FtsB